MRIEIPELSLVVLIGASGSGKSTFARKHFRSSEIVSSDTCREIVDDDENSLDATIDAFELVHFIARKRLKRGKLTVIDATNVQPAARKPLIDIANEYFVQAIAIVVDTPESVCQARNEARPNRQFGPHVVRNHMRDLRRSLGNLKREKFRQTYFVKPGEEIELVRTKLWTDRREEEGPFDIIGDVHGCLEELRELLAELGYSDGVHPEFRKAAFVGDLVDRGPDSPGVLKLVMSMVESGNAICVPGNHDSKLVKHLMGRDVQLTHGLDKTVEQLSQEPEEFRQKVKSFLDGLISHAVLDGGRLVIAHAGCREEMQGRAHARVRDFCHYGETTGETDEFGLPVRYAWAEDYRGKARVVYGHTPVAEPDWLNRTVNIDTGCVFGGKLTALRYPELEIVSVPAKKVYAEPTRPIGHKLHQEFGLTVQQEFDDLLDFADVSGKIHVDTRLSGKVTVREENSVAALETMSRFAADPKWLVYLPPTMSPCSTFQHDGFLEYPEQAFDYFRDQGVSHVVCEQKHMGSRAVVIVCAHPSVGETRFGVQGGGPGAILTRRGRKFFQDLNTEVQLLERVRDAFFDAGLFDELETDWAVLDCELMPWSAKASDLLKKQYAPTGVAACLASDVCVSVLEAASAQSIPGLESDFAKWRRSADNARKFVAAYREYCWPVTTIDDYKLAPFHLMATEGRTYTDRTNLWHMETLARACGNGLLLATPYRVVNLLSDHDILSATEWWIEMVNSGGEGMVVKPMDFVVKGKKGLVQPAIKVRGPEYLRIIYGPNYLEPSNLERLRKRGLAAKRSLALREFALGIEGLERFIRREPLRAMHECVFAVLALESEPVDPRL